MRRALFTAVLPVFAMLATVASAAPALASEQVTIPSVLPKDVICPNFDIDVGVIVNDERQDVTKRGDGTTITRVKGALVLSFTNHTTGKTIVRNLSGPTTTIAHTDTNGVVTGVETGTGNSWWGFGPSSKANTHEPGLVFTTGLVVLDFTGNIVNRFSLVGHQINGCDLLAR